MERIKRFTEIYESELQIIREGHAFISATKKAKDEGLEEFEFNGKKYPITIKDKNVSEGSRHPSTDPYAFYDSYETMEKELKQLKKISNPKQHILDKIEFLENGLKNKVLDEAVSPKVGDNFVHPVYHDITGKVLAGPDTFANIEKAGYDLPDINDLESASIVSDVLNKKVWYGVATSTNTKLGIHSDDIIKESLNEQKKIACIECDEVNTREAWKKNNGFCPSCEKSSQGVAESLVAEAASKSNVKRKYTESHPSIEIQNYAPIREKVLNFLKENGTVTRTQLKEFINGMNEEIASKTSMKWVNKNSRFIKEFASKGEVFYKLTPLGKRVVEKMMVKESEELLFEELNEGQFSWFTQDSHQQIGSERPNRIDTYMFDDKGNHWEEKKYEGYGIFGGKDYYDLLAEMNGYTKEDVKDIKGGFRELRQIGINLAFKEAGYKTRHPKGKTLFPALVTNKNFNWKSHDFTKQAENDPNQSWYQEEEDEDDNFYENNDWN